MILLQCSSDYSKLFETPIANISIHHVNPFLFSGYEMIGKNSVFMATSEKALFDTLYLMPAKSNLFKRLTELELPEDFNFALFKPWLKQVKNKSRRIMIETSLDGIRNR